MPHMDFDAVVIGFFGGGGLEVGKDPINETDKTCLFEKNNSQGPKISS